MAPEPVIHIVDDDDAVRDSLSVLFSVEGLMVRAYASAQAFLEELPSGHGCVVTDMHMAGTSGLQLLRQVKALGVGLPVVVITGRIDPALAGEVASAGAVALVEKPFGPSEIVAVVRAALQDAR